MNFPTEKCKWCQKTFNKSYIETHINRGECRKIPMLCNRLLCNGVSLENAIFLNDYLIYYGTDCFNLMIEKLRKEYEKKQNYMIDRQRRIAEVEKERQKLKQEKFGLNI